MDDTLNSRLDRLLTVSRTFIIEVDAAQCLIAVHGEQFLSVLPQDASAPEPGSPLTATLDLLFDPREVQTIVVAANQLQASPEVGSKMLGAFSGRTQRLALTTRHFELSLSANAGEAGVELELTVQDVSELRGLTQALEEALSTSDLSSTLLRSDPNAVRQFLQSAQTSVGMIRATLKLPARTQEALREKLGRTEIEATALKTAAVDLNFAFIALPCGEFVNALSSLQARPSLSGNDLLPLSLRMDAISAAINAAVQIDETRSAPPPVPQRSPRRRGGTRSTDRKVTAWPEACEKRCNQMLQSAGAEIGNLARLSMSGLEVIPESYRHRVDVMLEHLLRNAIEHGIETPETRVENGKPAAGQISVAAKDLDGDGVEITVHDDGQGFDLDRIGRAAVKSNLLTEEELAATDPRAVVGLIFKPTFSTEGVVGSRGQGRGMPLLRRNVSRLGGQISVATKSRRYTQFKIRLPSPAAEGADAELKQALP
jgi:signal transduction histidine kinase